MSDEPRWQRSTWRRKLAGHPGATSLSETHLLLSSGSPRRVARSTSRYLGSAALACSRAGQPAPPPAAAAAAADGGNSGSMVAQLSLRGALPPRWDAAGAEGGAVRAGVEAAPRRAARSECRAGCHRLLGVGAVMPGRVNGSGRPGNAAKKWGPRWQCPAVRAELSQLAPIAFASAITHSHAPPAESATQELQPRSPLPFSSRARPSGSASELSRSRPTPRLPQQRRKCVQRSGRPLAGRHRPLQRLPAACGSRAEAVDQVGCRWSGWEGQEGLATCRHPPPVAPPAAAHTPLLFARRLCTGLAP